MVNLKLTNSEARELLRLVDRSTECMPEDDGSEEAECRKVFEGIVKKIKAEMFKAESEPTRD